MAGFVIDWLLFPREPSYPRRIAHKLRPVGTWSTVRQHSAWTAYEATLFTAAEETTKGFLHLLDRVAPR